jgi:hypothetical protein
MIKAADAVVAAVVAEAEVAAADKEEAEDLSHQCSHPQALHHPLQSPLNQPT